MQLKYAVGNTKIIMLRHFVGILCHCNNTLAVFHALSAFSFVTVCLFLCFTHVLARIIFCSTCNSTESVENMHRLISKHFHDANECQALISKHLSCFLSSHFLTVPYIGAFCMCHAQINNVISISLIYKLSLFISFCTKSMI